MLEAVIVLVVLGLLGFPLWLTLAGAAIAGIWFGTQVPMEVIPQLMYGSLAQYVLLAVPGFILAGEIISKSGLALRLTDWISSLVGRVPANRPMTTIGVAEAFGAISGSSPATVAALGKVLLPSLRKGGYSESFSLGLITSSGAIASLIPPSITMILYSAATDTSLGDLFIAGVVPGLLVGAGLAVYSLWYTFRHKIRDTDASMSLKTIATATARASLALGVPIIVFGGIYTGIVTATEASGIVALYAALVGFRYGMRPRDLLMAARDAAELSAKIFIIVAAAGLFAFFLTVSGVPASAATFVAGIDMSPWMIILIINILLLIVGMFIDPASAVLVLAPILLPIAAGLGVDPIHFGVIMTLNLALGMFTPPIGLNIFVSASIFNVSASKVSTSVMPFIAVTLVVLLLVTYLPVTSLWLVNTMR